MCRSMRSSSGPEMRPMYFSIAIGAHLQACFGSPRKPHGHGFIAAISTKSAGKVVECAARLIVTRPSSSGWRSDFEAAAIELGKFVEEQNAVVGQRDLARLRDRCRRRPCRRREIVWCGLRNGRVLSSDSPGGSRPLAE